MKKAKYKKGDRLDAEDLGIITVEDVQLRGNIYIYKAKEFQFEDIWIEENNLERVEDK